MKLYVYSIHTRQHVATVQGKTTKDCEISAIASFRGDNSVAWTFTPNFGMPGGLTFNHDAIQIA